MTITNGSILRMAVVWKYSGSDEQVNVWHAGVTSVAPTLVELHEDIRDYIDQLYGTTLNFMVNNLIHDRIELFNQSAGTPEAWIGAYSALNGVDTAEALPTGVTALLYARTFVSRVIGKKYLPTASEGTLSDGVWAASYVTALSAMAARWELNYTGSYGTVFTPRIWRPSTNSDVAILNANASSVPAYQRRRKLGRGA